MKFRRAACFLTTALAAGGALADPPATIAADVAALEAVLSSYNVYVDGNFGTSSNPYTSDSQGAMAIGGNAWLTGFQAGSALPKGQTALTVGGTLTASNGSASGSVVVGGTTSFPSANGGFTVNGNLTLAEAAKNASLPSKVTGATSFSQVSAGGAAASIASTFSQLTAASQDLNSTLRTTGTAGTVSKNGNELDLTGTGSVNFFTVSASQLVGINGLRFNTAKGSTTIVDVEGQFAPGGTLTNFGFLGNVDPTHTLFNFVDAKQISLNGIGFDGSILAPNAQITALNGQFDGTVIANSFGSVTYNDAEFHEDAFQGYIDPPGTATPVPEPTALALLLAGMGSILLVFGRRPKARLAQVPTRR